MRELHYQDKPIEDSIRQAGRARWADAKAARGLDLPGLQGSLTADRGQVCVSDAVVPAEGILIEKDPGVSHAERKGGEK